MVSNQVSHQVIKSVLAVWSGAVDPWEVTFWSKFELLVVSNQVSHQVIKSARRVERRRRPLASLNYSW